jgi:hypothetical protein
VITNAERARGIAAWLLLAAPDTDKAREEWHTMGTALLRCGVLFTAVCVPGAIIPAAAGTDEPARVDAFLVFLLGPVFASAGLSRYYALVPGGTSWDWAILGTHHAAFVPGWEGRRDDAVERMVAARTYTRRGPASAELLAWLDAVEAECETRCGNTRTALHLIGHAEDVLAAASQNQSPPWLDWFSPVRLAAFKGNTQLKAGHVPAPRLRHP